VSGTSTVPPVRSSTSTASTPPRLFPTNNAYFSLARKRQRSTFFTPTPPPKTPHSIPSTIPSNPPTKPITFYQLQRKKNQSYPYARHHISPSHRKNAVKEHETRSRHPLFAPPFASSPNFSFLARFHSFLPKTPASHNLPPVCALSHHLQSPSALPQRSRQVSPRDTATGAYKSAERACV
jgi:hypothetical protein